MTFKNPQDCIDEDALTVVCRKIFSVASGAIALCRADELVVQEIKECLDGFIKRNQSQAGRRANEAKNADKFRVKDRMEIEWTLWQINESKYESNIDFARAMLNQSFNQTEFGQLIVQSEETITRRWIPEWSSKR